jgi:hypothetical protein
VGPTLDPILVVRPQLPAPRLLVLVSAQWLEQDVLPNVGP